VAWRRDGKELFYLAADRGIMSVQVNTASTFEFGKPKLLFKAPDSLPVTGTPGGLAAVSRDGQRFVFTLPPAPRLRQITVFNRQGKMLRTVGDPGLYGAPALSPDGSKVAVTRNDPANGHNDIWAFDMATGKSTAITIAKDVSPNMSPVWSPDGRQILYTSAREQGRFWGIYRKSADGSGAEEQLFQFTPGASMMLTDITADGKLATISSGGALLVLPLTGTAASRKPIEYARDEFDYFGGRFSPDSRFMAFSSDELGVQKNEVFVRPFDAATGTAPKGQWQISKDNASGNAQWRADGKELYIMNDDIDSGDLIVWAADVSTAPQFQVGTPKVLFRLAGPFQGGGPGNWNSASRDGQQFVFTMPVKR
jgi:Tol biopolymer transport system component